MGALVRWSSWLWHWVCVQPIWTCGKSRPLLGPSHHGGQSAAAHPMEATGSAWLHGPCVGSSQLQFHVFASNEAMCFPTDIKCCRSPWFSCLLEEHVILFFLSLRSFMGKWKVEGGFSVDFSFLWQIFFIYSILQCVVYSICSDIKQLLRLKPEVAAAILSACVSSRWIPRDEGLY